MNTKLEKNISEAGWRCHHCGGLNKVGAAKFCGHCGCCRLDNEGKVDEILTNNNLDTRQKICAYIGEIRTWFVSPKDFAFKGALIGAAFMLVFSVVAGYKMYTNVNTIRMAKIKFTDVALDHPVYAVCRKLLDIDAISFRKNKELAPYENISPREWNYVLEQASKRLNREYSLAAYFTGKDDVSLGSLKSKLAALSSDNFDITDTSRLQSFFALEQVLFN